MKVLAYVGRDWRSGRPFFTLVSGGDSEAMFPEFFSPEAAVLKRLGELAELRGKKLEYSTVSFNIEVSDVQFHEGWGRREGAGLVKRFLEERLEELKVVK